MTTCDEQTGNTGQQDLPLHPWTALHPVTGMLLGADDFEVLMGNPRGKHQLHNAWLHGHGVVWGLGVRLDGEWNLEVSPGLAVDGCGRELRLDAPQCVSFRSLLEDQHDPTCKTREVELRLVLSFDTCLDKTVPALADPCDVTRQSTEFSRVVERARLELVTPRPATPSPPYRRVRMLLGLQPISDDEAGAHARRCRDQVAAAPSGKRARALLRHFRCLAAEDAAEWHPATDDSGLVTSAFPVDEADAGVVLACLSLKIRDQSGCPEIVESDLDVCCRPTVVPTTVVQDLVCGLAPGLVGDVEEGVGLGPQVVAETAEWSDDAEELRFEVTEHLVPGSLKRAVEISSLSDTEWVVEDLMGPPRYHADSHTVVVKLADRPVNPLVRVVVRGTGRVPAYGATSHRPLAGVVGDRPGSPEVGMDAVLTVANPRFEEKSEGRDQK